MIVVFQSLNEPAPSGLCHSSIAFRSLKAGQPTDSQPFQLSATPFSCRSLLLSFVMQVLRRVISASLNAFFLIFLSFFFWQETHRGHQRKSSCFKTVGTLFQACWAKGKQAPLSCFCMLSLLT